jgi:hypothetical protein
MKVIKSRPAKLPGTFFALLLLSVPAFCQDGPLPAPPDPYLDTYAFLDTNDWTSDLGFPPIAWTNLVVVPEWLGGAPQIDTANTLPAFLNYNIVETNGYTNLAFSAGALTCVFICDWATDDTNQYGTGPGDDAGDPAFLLAAGDFSSGSPDGLWAIYFDPGGTNIYFGGVSNSESTVFVSAPISWPSNSAHEIDISYDTNTMLYLDGQLAATGGPVTIVPATNVWTNGFFIGSDSAGFEQARGVFWFLEFYDSAWFDYSGGSYWFFINWWPYLANGFASWQGDGGASDFAPGSPGSLLPAGISTGSTNNIVINTNYLNYTNFSLFVTNNRTSAFVSVVSSLSNLTYEILTNSSLASTNWGVWQILTASNSITPAPPINLSSNAMFFSGALVWSTGTNGLPDWWQMEYFGQLGVNPNGNPAGDGINNLNKYLMGLNPNIAYVSPLTVSPPGGDYVSMPAISVISLAGATIKYTTNGSTPSSTNGMAIASGVPLTNLPSGSFTLEAWESGLTSNVPAIATYTIIPATPTFSIPGGLYAVGTTLQISCATTNAIVCYTTNGIDPTTNSAQIQATNIITLTTNETIKAMAWLGTNASPVASAAYIIGGPLPPPPNDNFSNAITLSSSAGEVIGTTLRATLESFETNSPYGYFNYEWGSDSVWYKWTAPSNGAVLLNYFVYGVGINIYYIPSGSSLNPTNLVPVSSSDFSGNDYYSSILTATQSVTYYIAITSYTPGPSNLAWQYVGPAGAPVFSLYPGTYLTPELVTVSCLDPHATMRYTTNGVNPTTNDIVIASGASLLVYQTTTLKAMAWRTGLNQSAVTTALYTINPASTNPILTASAPVLSPGNTNFASSLTITLTCTNTGAVIYYTLDGSTPTSASASVSSGGTVTVTNSAPLNASAWVTNMNFSPITTGWYAKNGVDTTGDGIPDSAALAIGADPFVSDANAVNLNPSAHGLDNMQVYLNQSVLIANNYSTENDGIPDWWLVKNGYSVTTSANALGDNGQTLLASYLAGLNPNNPNSRPGQLPPIDFHMVHGPSNSMVMVLDNVTTNIVGYLLYCTEKDPTSPLYKQTVLEEFPTDAAMPVSWEQWGRYFQLTNQLPPGNWLFTLQGVDTSQLLTQTSSNTFGRFLASFNDSFVIGYNASYDGLWYPYVGVPIPVVGYTNNNNLKEPILAQILRAQSDTWYDNQTLQGQAAYAGTSLPVIYDDTVQSLTTEEQWGTLTFQYAPDPYSPSYHPVGLASYFTSICATPDVPFDCDAYYYGGDYFPANEVAPLQAGADNSGNQYFVMPETNNPAGLEYLSVTYRIGSNAPITLYPGQSNLIPNMSFTFEVALDTETPTLQTINYYFDGRNYPIFDGYGSEYKSQPQVDIPNSSPLYEDGWIVIPGEMVTIPVAVTNPVIIAHVGKPVNLQCWSQLIAVRPNGTQITNQSCWIDQDFAQAYLCNPATGDVPRTSQTNYNGKMKINTNTAVTTGILSPNLNYPQDYGEYINAWRSADFTPTQTGKVIVTTMPDANGYYGEVTIYVIDMQVDANHDGIMDNRDLTSVDNPMNFWVNGNFDRNVLDSDDNAYYNDDVATTDPNAASPGTPGISTPDFNYLAGDGKTYCIPNERDLQDYARLWIPGLSNMVANLPAGCGVNLQWRNNTGAAIRLFKAAETNGSTNYLFNQSEGLSQVEYTSYPCYGYVTPTQTISLSQAFASTTVPTPSDYFIFCGAAYGNDELVLQITNQYGGEVGEASVFLNLQDIKQMYERWSVGENPLISPNNIATNAGDDGFASFQYPYDPSIDSTTPYILYVHGWNMPTWEKDRFAEAAYKRLYWQGYQGRFGVFRWPTGSGFVGISTMATNITEKDNYDLSEYEAWQSATGLLNKLSALNIQYPGQVYMLAHSMGNVVASEALRLAGTSQLVNTYVASQAAITAHTYDPTVTNYSFSYSPWSSVAHTPNIYGNWFATNNGNGAGQIISFYNVNDFALQRSVWQLDQLFKPDQLVIENGQPWDYGYSGSTNDPAPWNNFYKEYSSSTVYFNIVGNLLNRYEVMGLAAEPYTTALGATPGVNNVFLNVNLDRSGNNAIWPGDPTGQNYIEHFWHSAEFRGDYWQQQGYWSELLGSEAFNLK